MLSNLRPSYKNLIITGDFNIHVDNRNDLDACLEALSLKQHNEIRLKQIFLSLAAGD